MKTKTKREARIPSVPSLALSVREDLKYSGLGVSAGIAIGPAHVMEQGLIDVPEYIVTDVEEELARFDKAAKFSIKQVEKLRVKASTLSEAAAEELNYLLEAHLQMLAGSRLVRGVEKRIRSEKLNAEAAVQAELSEIAHAFSEMEDSYLASKIQDVREVSARLVRNLTKAGYQAFSGLAPGSIIIAEEITPADTALMDPNIVGGFASALGGAEDHTTIMARSLGLPAVLGVSGLVNQVRPGDMIVVDGVRGTVVVNPTEATIARFERRREALFRRQRQLERLRSVPATTRDDMRILLQCNLELPYELALARQVGAEGVGLLRSEFLYMNRDTLPSEDEQFVAFKEIVEGMEGHPVTVRTLDVGSDKLAYSLGEHISPSTNPALGLRAIRLSLKVRKLLETQLAAMLRASAHGELRILLPMINSASEIKRVQEAMDKVVRRLTRKRVAMSNPLPKLGIMIETPGAALAADSLAKSCDYFSIGTNDLTMYTLAADRGDEQVAHLYDPLHPAVLRLIKISVEAGRSAGIPVNLCGEMAGDPRFTALLLGLGLRDLSMAAPNLPRVKQRILGLGINDAEKRAEQIMEQTDSGVIATLIDDFNALD
ncbi:MAG: phosphoenolpyruvate--protein phosphotransferase [Rhodospirillaceae bacterium]|nr:phosphoenolpyruvate--protein phosphotransferase [Rhodospirillaceae bacterium]